MATVLGDIIFILESLFIMSNLIKNAVISSIAIGVFTASSAAMAQASVTFEVTSNKIGRGVPTSNDGPGVTGNLVKRFSNGAYLGVIGSNVHLPPSEFTKQTYEVDVYGGYTKVFPTGFYLDLGYMYYAFPAASSELSGTDYSEVYGVLGYKNFAFEVDYTLDKKDSDGSDDNEHDVYFKGTYTKKLKSGIEYSFTAGRVDSATGSDYNHYQAAISKNSFKLAIDDNNIKDFGLGDPRISVTWTKVMDF